MGGFLDDILNANCGGHWIGIGCFHVKENGPISHYMRNS